MSNPVPAAESRYTGVAPELHHEIGQFLYREAELIDDHQFRAWLELLADDIHYTMRTEVNATTRDRRRGVEPPSTWIFNESKFQLERRVARLETGKAWAEEPPSRTRHLLTNIQIRPAQAHPGEFEVRVNYLLHRSQKERDQTSYVGVRYDRLRRAEGTPDGWQIAHREIKLDQVVLNSHNLSVFF